MTNGSLPPPFVAPDVDVRDLDGFMLNVERLMASELVALSSHEVVAACVFLWCRAWKQMPAASLPDDDRVIAAYSRLPAARYRKLKVEILRGFVKCSDGRLYHRVLGEEATRAFGRKTTYMNRRDKDAERLRQWRLKQAETTGETQADTTPETSSETSLETRFVAEDTVRYDTVRKIEEGESRERATFPSKLVDGKSETISNSEPKPKATTKRGRSSKGLVPWPPDFELTAGLREYAQKHGFDADWLFEKFHNKALAVGWQYRDWPAAFRTFAQNERTYTPQGRPNGAHQAQAWRPPDV